MEQEKEYFGERALLDSRPRAANVIATSKTKVMYIHKSAFEEVLGPLANIIDEDRLRRENIDSQVVSVPASRKEINLMGVISLDARTF